MYEQLEALFAFIFYAIGGMIVLVMVLAGLAEALAEKRHARAIERRKNDL